MGRATRTPLFKLYKGAMGGILKGIEVKRYHAKRLISEHVRINEGEREMSDNSSSSSSGVGFVGLLTVLFVALKLMGYITWSWWWVLSPLWITPIVVIFTLFALILIASR